MMVISPISFPYHSTLFVAKFPYHSTLYIASSESHNEMLRQILWFPFYYYRVVSCDYLLTKAGLSNWVCMDSKLRLPTSQWSYHLLHLVSLEAQMVENPTAVQETLVQSLGQEDLLEKGMAAHSNSLTWEIPWTEEPGELQSTGSQRVRHDWMTHTFTFHLAERDGSQNSGTIIPLPFRNAGMINLRISKLDHLTLLIKIDVYF